MSFLIGLDIGGTKIAGAVFAQGGAMLAELVEPTQHDYTVFLKTCHNLVLTLEARAGDIGAVGIGIAGRIRRGELADASPNMPFLQGKTLKKDLETLLDRNVRLANDANCMALAEAIDGAGKGFSTVLGLTLGTGVGAGFVIDGRLLEGANSLAGEIGHIPLPFRDETDGPVAACNCKQQGCIEKSISGGALARLYKAMTGEEADAKSIGALAERRDTEALRVLDQYYETFAKAMIAVVNTLDPDVIVASGSMSALPGLFDEVPKRWGKYAYMPKLETQFLPAYHGPLSGLRGAAWLWR